MKPGRRSRVLWGAFFSSLFVLSHATFFLLGEQTLTHDSRNWLPIFAMLSDGIRHGGIPGWSPYTNTGEFCFHLPTMFRFYDPGTLLTAWAGGRLGVPILAQCHADYLRRFLCFAWGAALFSSLFARNRRTPLFVYVTVLFSSIPVTAFRQNCVILDAYTVPFFLFFYHRMTRGFRWTDLFFCAFFFGMGAANYRFPEAVWFYAVYLLLHAFLVMGKDALARIRLGPLLLRCALGGLVALACSAYLLTLFQERHTAVPTIRSATGTDMEDGFQVPFGQGGSHASLIDLASLLCPGWGFIYYARGGQEGLTNECTYYAGIWMVPLALLGLVRSRQRVKWVWLLSLVALVSILHGTYSPLAYLSFHCFPAFDLIRHMALFQPFLMLMLIWTASLGADLIFRLIDTRRRTMFGRFLRPGIWSILFYAGLMFVLLKTFLALPLHPGLTDALKLWRWGAFFHLTLLLCVGVLCAGLFLGYLFWKGRLGTRGLLAGATVLFLFDLMTMQRALATITLGPRAPYEIRMPEGFPFLDHRLDHPDAYEHQDIETVYGYLPMIEKRPYAFVGHEKKLILEMRDYRRLRCGIPSDQVRANLFAVTTPILRFTEGVGLTDREAYFESLLGKDAEPVSREVWVHPPTGPAPTGVVGKPKADAEAAPRVIDFGPDHILIEMDAPRPGFLYYADQYHPHWRASVDGREAPVVRANYAYKGLFLEAGSHLVEFRFRPDLFRYGLWAMLGTNLLALGLSLWMTLRKAW